MKNPRPPTELNFDNEEYHILKHRYQYDFIDKIYASTIKDQRLIEDLLTVPTFHETSGLAGDIADEQYFIWDNNEFLLQAFKEEFKAHISRIYNRNIMDISFANPDNVKHKHKDYIWINYSKPMEYNPLHNHTGLLSFVYYPDIPEVIRNEWKNQTNNFGSRGCIEFVASRESDSITLNPKKGDLFIFDSGHRHEVYPFYSNETRISIAGNVYGLLDDQGNVIGSFV